MNKVCLTKRGLQFINQEKQDHEESRQGKSLPLAANGRRSNSLPQLISILPPTQKQQISAQISHLTLKLARLKQKGLKQMLLDKQDENMINLMQQQFSDKSSYLRSILPALVKKTRNQSRLGNMQSRMERSRAYINSLQHHFDNKFVFSPRRASVSQK